MTDELRRVKLIGGPYDGHRLFLKGGLTKIRLPLPDKALRKKDAIYILDEDSGSLHYQAS